MRAASDGNYRICAGVVGDGRRIRIIVQLVENSRSLHHISNTFDLTC